MSDPRRDPLGPKGKADEASSLVGSDSGGPRSGPADQSSSIAPRPGAAHQLPNPEPPVPTEPGESDESIAANRVPEWLTSFLDGEASGEEKARAKQALATSGELKKEAEELQKAWDLLDFLPKNDPEPEKSRATMEMVLSRVSGAPERVDDEAGIVEAAAVAGDDSSALRLRHTGLGQADIRAEWGSHLDRRTEHPHLSSTASQRTKRARVLFWFRQTFPLAAMGLCGMLLGLMALGGWNSVDSRRREKLQKIQGVVENLQLLREAGNLEFLEAIGQSDLFGQSDAGAARE